MLRSKKNSKIDILLEFFIDKIGKDITVIILKYVEYIKLVDESSYTLSRIEMKLTKKKIIYNNVLNEKKKKSMSQKQETCRSLDSLFDAT